MAITREETIEQLHRRERDALVQAAKAKTALIASIAALGGLIAGVYIGRDVANRFFRDLVND